ncbi:NACHT, LRR and PYD domains-containing protein 3-like [Colossoma macropomum]|uniref:NACHT, LRR and PYD domains-containing protein 3-like n=1 Tax=Colossoma macropomum TaxID=42526 RepID=UPI001863B053|nr:NACHT, LRR and PYD domains-containing protein 3-like [Colossoma macropomum]
MELHNSSAEGTSDTKVKNVGSPEPSCESMKSDQSPSDYPVFSSLGEEPSCLSMKSDQAIENPPGLGCGAVPSDPEWCPMEATLHIYTPLERTEHLQQEFSPPTDDILYRVLERHKTSLKNKYESLFEGMKTQENKTFLNRIYTQLYVTEEESEGMKEQHEVLQMEKAPRKSLPDISVNCLDIFKPLQGAEVEVEENIKEHKKRKLYKENMKAIFRFRGLRHKDRKENKGPKVPELRSVLTKGIAGIGKTVSVQKFILDWAEGEANQDVDVLFVLPFRELNLIKDNQYSLHGLLCDFHPELKDLDRNIYDVCKAMFIFDGLDESRIPLNFLQCEKVSDITMTSSVDVLMTNLIKGELLPSALIWITSRPAAANQIPPKYINRVTEIQGFSDPQKEEYFRKRISDEDQAQRIISHIKTARSLHIMCHIPVFCWISATVLQRNMTQSKTEIPTTLTEMYSHFLFTQINMNNEKYEDENERDTNKLLESNRTILLKLAELAFKQLMKGNVMFYEEDLRESGIDVTEVSVYSGIFTEIFREECKLYQKKVFCFVHLSFQEFLAAIYVLYCFESKIMEALHVFLHDHCYNDESRGGETSDRSSFETDKHRGESENVPLDRLLMGAVHKAVESQDGQLDLFLIFLLGISLESNQRLLQGLLTQAQSNSQKTLEYIKELIKGEGKQHIISTEQYINLFLCLSEMNDQSLSDELQEHLKSEKHADDKLSPGQCSALACMLLISDGMLDELDLKKYNTSEEGYKRLIPAVTACKKAILADCDLTMDSWETLCSALQSANSSLKELDISNNDLQNSRVELLLAGLKSSHCKLEILRLAFCELGDKACENLGSALQSANFCLKELDLSNNDLQDSGVKLLSVGLMSSQCKLETLRLALCNLGEKACKKLGLVLSSGNSSLKELDLSNNDLQDSGVELLSVGLKSSHSKLEILRLALCNIGEKGCKSLGSALHSVKSFLKMLDLSNNDLKDTGVEWLSVVLKTSHCKLEILRLSGCMVTDEGCCSLALALKSNPSQLRELDLTYNHPGDSAVKLLSDRLEDPQCTLEKLQVEHGGKIRMKPGLKKYACDLTLDPNTAHTRLSLSDENKKVERVDERLWYLDNPERFQYWEQVLSVESLTGRCYWEAEWSESGAYIAVSYREISREGNSSDSGFGLNKQSWSLYCSDDKYTVRHNGKETVICAVTHRLRSRSSRIGVYLDWMAGSLSFYSISPNTNKLTHIHTLYSTFTKPLYAGFRVDYGSSLRVCHIE